MTAEEYDALSEEEQRIAVAELCGWKKIKSLTNKLPIGLAPYSGRLDHYRQEVPDYLNDLNAMHEAENQIRHGSTGIRERWVLFLAHVVTQRKYMCIDLSWGLSCLIAGATAKQRCKAFVLTMTEEDGK